MSAARLRTPPARLLTGHASDLRRDRLGAMTRWAREYGDVVPLRLGPLRGLLLAHPDRVEEVLVTRHHDFIRAAVVRSSRLTFGDALFAMSGPDWLRHRRLAQPAFHRRRVDAYGERMVEDTVRVLSRWRDGERRDVHAEMQRLTLAITTRTLFGADVGGDAGTVGAALDVVMERFRARLDAAVPLPDTLPTYGNLRNRRALRRLDGVVDGVIRRARAAADGSADGSTDEGATDGDAGHLLGLLLRARDGAGGGLSDGELRDEALGFLLAGHETTALALTWAFHLLARDPGVRARLEGELDAVLGGRAPRVADLPRLAYTDRVLREAMRLYPPSYAFGRESTVDCEIGGHPVRAGTTVIMSQWVLHRDPRFFDAPDAFDPDRWAGDLARRLPRFAYLPFGGGPQRCIGAAFATMEATLVLATVAQRFRLASVPGHPVVPEPSITLRPRHGLPMIVRARGSARASG